MAAGDLNYGVQDVKEEFAIVPGTGGKKIYVVADFSMGWRGKPLTHVQSLYEYEFTDEGLITDWEAHYDPIFLYDALGGREGEVSCATAEPLPSSSGVSSLGLVSLGTAVGALLTLLATGGGGPRSSTKAAPVEPML